jgi:type II restriction enzyme
VKPIDYTRHLTAADDLVTSYKATRTGFIRMALEKNREAVPYVSEAKILKSIIAGFDSPKELLQHEELQPALLTAAGISDKANAYLTDGDRIDAIREFIEKFLEPAGEDFADEFIFRFLLVRGDALGGKMRNIAGRLAEKKVTRLLIATLSVYEQTFSWLDKSTNRWIAGDKNDPDIEARVRGLHWQTQESDRVLLYNLTVPFVGERGNNVDLCLLAASPKQIFLKGNKTRQSIHRAPDAYLALGKLKGGIDPAGADEHWKTARSALDRIRKAFSARGFEPKMFYIGAAIQDAMAAEIFARLQAQTLHNAANLTVDEQINSLCAWLVNID